MNDRSQFVEIIKQHEGIIFKIASMYARNTEEKKDLYQEIVYQFWKSFDSFKSESKISTWLYRVALNTSITFSKREKKKNIQSAVDVELLRIADEKDHTMEEMLGSMYSEINRLGAIEKGIVLLYLEGKNYDEMAQITGLTSSNIGTRLSRIKEKLRSKIKKN